MLGTGRNAESKSRCISIFVDAVPRFSISQLSRDEFTGGGGGGGQAVRTPPSHKQRGCKRCSSFLIKRISFDCDVTLSVHPHRAS